MTQKELQEKRRENEERQEENRTLKTLLERSMSETEHLFARERHHNDQVLTYFHRQEEVHFFEDITEESRLAERRFLDAMTDGQETLHKENRRLEDESDLLYEAELQQLRKEDERDGQNDHW
ncbi:MULTISPECIES: hypothetical protein [unclassified Enterococcus]|uniref:hypothetical protein n=1 Tax=unclassified Enterococcus TaxID=2608891 RepID=UPI001CE0EE85|nr:MULTISPECIES: hypothetical protein [unclassified Enterococcus]MCA5013624.1 DUF3958 family protein [Enterococcus sp. S23]MCA5016874.1 DUF3958 family protein [Enterococcus sp. S22(2020)]